MRGVPNVRSVIRTRHRDESTIAIEAGIRATIIVDRERSPPTIWRGCIPNPGNAVPGCTDNRLRASVKARNTDATTRPLEHGNRNATDNVRDDHNPIGAPANYQSGVWIELYPRNAAAMISKFELQSSCTGTPHPLAAILTRRRNQCAIG